MDTIPPDARSENMRRIRSRDTKPEVAVRSLLHRMGFRFRIHRSDLPGKPDIVLPKHRAVVFVHGCFWHQHTGCIDGRQPKSNGGYWAPKLARNIERDRQAREALHAAGYRVFTVWECDLKDTTGLQAKLRDWLRGLSSDEGARGSSGAISTGSVATATDHARPSIMA